ncbi:MAG: DUF4290 domain-containing protein, partial [Bacteroidales bacterium]|nr:DUF4290 domain-containing protein [Bacteroidales bacterium]
EDRDKRNEQIRAVVQVMGLLNPQMKETADWKQKLWDHMQMIAGFDIDIDSPYPVPEPKDLQSRPEPIPIDKTPVKAACYGRNIENMIDLIAGREDDEAKTEMIRMLALYMRQQYLIWNKDSVADETIFADMERLSNGRLKVPEGMQLKAIANDANFSRPGLGNQNGGNKPYGFNKKKNKKKKRI